MKNTLKRILLLLPVISVLLVALAVPVFADYSPETGWDAPVGTIEPVDSISVVYIDSNSKAQRTEGSVGIPFVIDGRTFNFRYKVVFNIDPSFDYGNQAFIDDSYFLAEQIYSNRVDYTLKNQLYGSGVGRLMAMAAGAGSNYTGTLVCYFENYPFTDVSSELIALSNLDFEVYEVASPSLSEPVTSVFADIMTWITSALNSVMGAFYVDGSLTLLGTLAVIGVSVGIGFLLIGLIQRFLKLRG